MLHLFAGSNLIAQEPFKPITKRHLISALKLAQKQRETSTKFAELIERYGVDFKITERDENEIRSSAKHLPREAVDDLITAVRDNYRPKSSGVYLDLTLYEREGSFPASQYPGPSMKLPVETTLRYSYERKQNKLKVHYTLPYLDLLARGGPISPVYDTQGSAKLFWQYPRLAVKVVNNSSKTVLFTEAALEVTSSTLNKEPVLLINYGRHYSEQGKDKMGPIGAFHIINDGWGDVVDAVVNLEILSPGFPELHGQKRTFRVGTFSEVATINLLQTPRQGFEGCREEEMGGSVYANVNGEIIYLTESRQERTVKFTSPVLMKFCGGLAGVSRETATYDVELESGKSGYVALIPLAQEVRAGDTDYFVFRLAASKSANFDLKISFRTPGIQLPENNLSIDVFVPRSDSFFSEPARRPNP